MGFGNVGYMELLFVLALWGIPLAIGVWFVRMLLRISNQLRDLSHRMTALERTVHEATPIRRTP